MTDTGELARLLVTHLVDEQFGAVNDMLNPEVRTTLPATLIEDGWHSALAAIGAVNQVGAPVPTWTTPGVTQFRIRRSASAEGSPRQSLSIPGHR